ncbi:hypothetical protein JX265_005247 [Neoarthrinium moseri]|uniref:F-box domain-containing protein n=1 Tax=Neoarthrinium moseri TaxID=1658444 RepID=A0A9Q0AQY2_9PEZI|nr:hypothetical protein JX265_005247 [Neoarthrinium moseri]
MLFSLLEHLVGVPSRQEPGTDTAASCLQHIPIEVHRLIIEHLGRDDFAAYLCVCRAWRRAGLSDDVWPQFAHRCLPGLVQHVQFEAQKDKSVTQSHIFRRALMKICRRVHGRFITAREHELRLGSEDYFILDTSLPISGGGVHSYDAFLNTKASNKLRAEHESLILPPANADHESIKKILWYAHGRIAWTSSITERPLLVVIDDLRTRTRRAYAFPEPQAPEAQYETALGSQLFVMSSGRKMCIWHLERSVCVSVALPMPLIRCVTEGERVLAVTTNAEVFIWSSGSGLQTIDMSSVAAYKQGELEKCYYGHFKHRDLDPPLQTALCYKGRTDPMYAGAPRRHLDYVDNFDFIVHPQDSSAIFVASFFETTLIVQEFSAGSWKTYRSPVEINVSHPYLRYISLRKASSHGDYVLCETVLREAWINDREAREFGVCCRRSSRDIEISVSFNLYTKAFHIARHHFRGHNRIDSAPVGEKDYSLWNQQLLHLTYSDRGYNVLAIGGCKQDLDYPSTQRPVQSLSQLPVHTAVCTWLHASGPMRRQTIAAVDAHAIPWADDEDLAQGSYHQDVAFCLDLSRMGPPQYFWQKDVSSKNRLEVIDNAYNKKYLLGDDEFLVFMRGGNSYTVFQFDHNVYT